MTSLITRIAVVGFLVIVFLLKSAADLSGAVFLGFTLVPASSAPAVETNFTAGFTAPEALGGLSQIVFAFDSQFSIPSEFSFLDVDLTIAGMSQNLSASPGDLISGMMVEGDEIEITLGRLVSVDPGSEIEILLGTHAQVGGQGVRRIINPSSFGTYGVSLQIFNAADVSVAAQAVTLLIQQPIQVSATVGEIEEEEEEEEEPTPSGGGAFRRSTQPTEAEEAVEAEPLERPQGLQESEGEEQEEEFHPADTNHSHIIDVSDFALMLSGWQAAEAGETIFWERADINQDNQVTLQDVSIFLFYWDGP